MAKKVHKVTSTKKHPNGTWAWTSCGRGIILDKKTVKKLTKKWEYVSCCDCLAKQK